MSRLSRNNVWLYHLGDSPEAKCLCCRKTPIHKSASKDGSKAWARGHIIHHKNHGPDVYENIRPICLRCNSQDKNYEDSYAYMVSIGTMTEADRVEKITALKKLAIELLLDPTRIHCTAKLESGEYCKNKKKPNLKFCGIHGRLDTTTNECAYCLYTDLMYLRNIHRAARRNIIVIDPFDEGVDVIDAMIREVTAAINCLSRVRC